MVQTKASVFEELLEWHKAFRCGLWFVRFRAWLSNVKHIEGNTKATKALLAFTFFVSCLYVSPKMYFISVFSCHRNLSQFYLIFVIRDSRFQTTDNIFIIRRGTQFAPFTTSPPLTALRDSLCVHFADLHLCGKIAQRNMITDVLTGHINQYHIWYYRHEMCRDRWIYKFQTDSSISLIAVGIISNSISANRNYGC